MKKLLLPVVMMAMVFSFSGTAMSAFGLGDDNKDQNQTQQAGSQTDTAGALGTAGTAGTTGADTGAGAAGTTGAAGDVSAGGAAAGGSVGTSSDTQATGGF